MANSALGLDLGDGCVPARILCGGSSRSCSDQRLECTPLAGQLVYGSLDSVPGELLLEFGWAVHLELDSYRFPDTLCRELKSLADHLARFTASVFHLLDDGEFSHQVLVIEPFPKRSKVLPLAWAQIHRHA